MAKKKKEEAVEKEQTQAVDTEVVTEEAPNECEKLTEELAQLHDRHLRLAAEYENFRKRSAKEKEDLYTEIRAQVLTKFLPVYDNLERALKQETTDEAFKKGVEMTMTQLCEIMKSMGVEEIPDVDHEFDPNMHNAVMHIDDESYGKNIIVEVFQKGFIINGRVVRYSMVKVAN